MISCNLQGGLGNQLFQIAAAKSLSIDAADDFSIEPERCYTPNQGHKSERYSKNIFKKINKSKDIPTVIFQEESFQFSPIPKIKNITLNGYFQSEKYFLNNKREIVDLFYPTDEELAGVSIWKKERGIEKPSVSVHVRRGDYLKVSDYHAITPISYFDKSTSTFSDVDFIVFSDDIKWAKENLKIKNCHFSDSGDEISDFYLMLSCSHNIISNSSFSWWAAYLNKNEDKRVVAPSRWFTEKANLDTSDLIPESWEII